MSNPNHDAPPPRWWPAVALVLLALGAAWYFRSGEADNRQNQFLVTVAISLLAGMLLLIWLLGFSRLRWKVRGLATLILIVVSLGCMSSIRVDGFSGNMVPQLSWRWSPPPEALALNEGQLGPVASGATTPSRPDVSGHPQFMGANRDGHVKNTQVALDRLEEAPKELWRVPVGTGWAGFAIENGIAVTLWQEGAQEKVVALDAWSGERLWAYTYTARHEDPIGGSGPRSVPTIHDGRVVTLGGTGILNAFVLSSGELLWSVDVVQDRGSSVPDYGVSTSPLIFDGQVIVLAGGAGSGSLAAYSLETGDYLWSGGGDPAAYSSPLLAEIDGELQVVVLNDRNVVGHALPGGDVRWSTPWPRATEKCAQPVFLPGGRLFVSSGYGVGGKLYRIEQGRADLLWENRNLKAKFATPIFHDGHLYGLDDGILVSVDVESGERNWKKGRYGHGQMLLVDDTLLIQAENGSVAWVAARPDTWREIASFQALEGKTWNHPALAGELLVVRNDTEAAAFRLPVKSEL